MACAPKNPKKGQMLVVVMMMITTVIIMFGMTVSVGHLVQSKVNLQTAVDLSALSASSYQARHMNSMSVVNYRIRAVLKYFLLDSYVTQGRFNNGFLTEVLGGGSGTISDPIGAFSVCQQAKSYSPQSSIRESGRGVDESTNVCRNFLGDGKSKKITPIIASPFPGLNPIYVFINMTLLSIANEFQKSCTEWQGQNGVWANWAIGRAAADTSEQSSQMPKVVNAFMNDVADKGDSVMLGASGRASQSAVATFRANLIGSLTQSGSDLNSLLYLNNASDRYLSMNDLTLSKKAFGLSYVEPKWSNGCDIVNNPGGPSATAREMHQGYSKKPGKTIAVGIVANADSANILFWPREIAPAMVAIAAAKPFGSRIGPPTRYFEMEGQDNGWGNVALYPGDRAGSLTQGGLGNKDILLHAFRQLPKPGSGRPNERPGGSGPNSMAFAAYAPSIFDNMYYSVFNPSSEYMPLDVIPKLTINSSMDDRGGSRLPDPYEWNDPPLAKYYRPQSAQSAWSPDPDSDRRSGYQIKLISIDELCNISTAPRLRSFCQKEGTRLL